MVSLGKDRRFDLGRQIRLKANPICSYLKMIYSLALRKAAVRQKIKNRRARGGLRRCFSQRFPALSAVKKENPVARGHVNWVQYPL